MYSFTYANDSSNAPLSFTQNTSLGKREVISKSNEFKTVQIVLTLDLKGLVCCLLKTSPFMV